MRNRNHSLRSIIHSLLIVCERFLYFAFVSAVYAEKFSIFCLLNYRLHSSSNQIPWLVLFLCTSFIFELSKFFLRSKQWNLYWDILQCNTIIIFLDPALNPWWPSSIFKLLWSLLLRSLPFLWMFCYSFLSNRITFLFCTENQI